LVFQTWKIVHSKTKIEALRNKINTYDSKRELIQILDTETDSGYIKLLYRYKK